MTQPCDFCNRDMIAERIIFESREAYVVATLGQITPGYILLIPKDHRSCVATLSGSELQTMNMYQLSLTRVLEEEYLSSVSMFEHGITGQSIPHAHIHLVPGPGNFLTPIRKDYPTAEIEPYRSLSEFKRSYAAVPRRQHEEEPYLLWRNGSERNAALWVCWTQGLTIPRQYLRQLYAAAVGRPKQADWRQADPIEDEKLQQDAIRRLRPRIERVLRG